ncbi:MAG: 50S ribosomal protein L24 [Clostridia bacterium]|nr:50S ribosomal protein L24 [Clostridia bacterium]
MKKLHVRAGDNITVLTGKDKGKHGKIIEVNPDKGRVLVEGVNMATKHVKPKRMDQQGGIIHQEAYIDASNVMLICSKCKKPARTERRIEDSGRKVRVCKKCGQVIDVIKEAAK